ncbi:tRNA dimethylallyltransferase [Anaerocolumna cellulosilytica]|uniref:tRNA dimethylallyltransferase n=1 Tax=Anaerocolumna cellulosilytica TaxID=433286 RepID=A0A6S6QWP7_9FIRM|nr:tRNA (adenosine(37)-N6)-dimethylallyltransferase MiaA [Anaerocolumna cellulosilytica]MBB5193739.1 tRNA dimethylallyltransferase [Anaerocolumna cellulosilytica]BCJ95044.1 tRNA dimethylallyltransferase [Anaerocolumna cellulosilytica]
MDDINKKPLVILTGPTAVGKTELSVKLAKAVNGEIISADSMQVYKQMDIGTAKIKKEEMGGIPHYLIDILEPQEEFNVVKFKEYSLQAMEEIYEKGKVPIIVGGTGFYIQAVLYGIHFEENGEDTVYRVKLEEVAKEMGSVYLHEKLKEADPAAAEAIHPNNVKRVIRALEYFEQTGNRISEHNEEQRSKVSPYRFCYFVLNNDRDVLYERINKRIDIMLEQGLVEEVKRLLKNGCTKEMVSMQGLGYKEIIEYLQGNCTLEEAVYLLKRDTRHFAKRQLTWFRREKEVNWIQKNEYGDKEDLVLEALLSELKKKEIG